VERCRGREGDKLDACGHDERGKVIYGGGCSEGEGGGGDM